MENYEKSLKEKEAMKKYLDPAQKVCESELRLCTMIAEENLPFSFSDSLIAVLKKSFQDPVLDKVTLGRQKCGNMIRGMQSPKC